MTTREELIRFLEARGIRPPGDPSPEIYTDDWFRFPFGSRQVPVFRLGPIKQSLMLHDIHHLLTGYGTDLRGELELAGWELGSGGCAAHKFMWFDRLGTALFALVGAPGAFFRAVRAGRASRNLYREDLDEVLALDVTELRSRMRIERGRSA